MLDMAPELNNPPTAFNLISPADEATITEADLTGGLIEFKWTASSDPDPDDAIGDYHFYGLKGAIVDYDTTITDTVLQTTPPENGTYQWFVTVTDSYGATTVSDTFTVTFDITPVSVEEGTGLPKEFAVHQNYPNPFNPNTIIRYDMPEAAHVTVSIYNLLGERVSTLLDGKIPAGYHQVVWNSTDEAGRPVSSGIYFYRVMTEKNVAIKRMVLLR